MSLPIIAIRPEPGCSATVSAGRAMDLTIEGYPLFEIRALEWEPPEPDTFDALLLGSANAFRHGEAIAALMDKPVFAVGKATAAEAEAHGFSVEMIGSRGLQPLLDQLAGKAIRFLRVAGAEHVELRPPADVTIETRIAYSNVSLAMPESMAKVLCAGAVVLLHSAAAARHFLSECNRLAVDRRGVHLAAIGPRVAAEAGSGWAALRSADRPDETALLALAGEMCHESPRA